MMIIGVDFGSKRIGIATADTEAGMAFPMTVLDNNSDFFDNFKNICLKEKVELVVLGDSKDFNMVDNEIMKKITPFKERVEKELGIKVEMQSEFLSSAQALHNQPDTKMLDAGSATIILQAYLDRETNNQ